MVSRAMPTPGAWELTVDSNGEAVFSPAGRGHMRHHPGNPRGGVLVWLWIVLLILIAIIFGLGFVVKWLFYIAIALFLVWVIMLLVGNLRGRA